MTKYGTTAFTFPIGANGVYAPISIDAVLTNCTFKVEYIAEDPSLNYNITCPDTSMDYVSRCGYWIVDRAFGTQNTTPTIGWDNNPCFGTDPQNAKVALWNGSSWTDKGNASSIGTYSNGKVKSLSQITTYPAVINLGGKCNCTSSNTVNVNAFSFEQNGTEFIQFNILHENPDNLDYLVVLSNNQQCAIPPQNGVDYTSSYIFGNGASLCTQSYIVNNSSNNIFTVSGPFTATQLFYDVYLVCKPNNCYSSKVYQGNVTINSQGSGGSCEPWNY